VVLDYNWYKNIGQNHLKSINTSIIGHAKYVLGCIVYTCKEKVEKKLPFLDIVLYKKGDGKLGYWIYRKKTHIERYLHADSQHHLAEKQGVICTLATRAIRVSDIDHLNKEFDHLRDVFQMNGYHDR